MLVGLIVELAPRLTRPLEPSGSAWSETVGGFFVWKGTEV